MLLKITLATYGATLEAATIMLTMALSMIAGIGVSALMAMSYAVFAEEDVSDGVLHAMADAVFIGGLFAFVSAAVNAVKVAVRSYKTYQEKLIQEYIEKYATSSEDALNIANSFEGKVRLKTSKGVNAHRYYDDINAFAKGRYLTKNATNNPIKDLVLINNEATKHIVLTIEKGQQYLVGHIAGSPVNAIQYFVGHINMLLP